MRVYLDACCLSRLSDDQSQDRIRREAQAIERIFMAIREGSITWMSSSALTAEVNENSDAEKIKESLALLALASEIVHTDEQVFDRAGQLHRAGYGLVDAWHLSYAEAAHVDVLLTTDDAFLRRAARGLGRPTVSVQNPLSWTQEFLT
jgi:predicted nucleic acid-binding protein